MMLRMYNCKDVKEMVAEYEWSEIFPVTRRTGRSSFSRDFGKCVSRLDSTINLYKCHHPSRRLKLPHIDVETRSHGDVRSQQTYSSCHSDQSQSHDIPLRGFQSHMNAQKKYVKTTAIANTVQHSIIEKFGGYETEVTAVVSHCKDGNTDQIPSKPLVVKLPKISNNLRVALFDQS